MRYAAAYLLANLSGNANPDEATISKILASVGIECDSEKAKKVINACKGKSVDQIIEEGTKKLSSLPAAGPVGAAPAAASGGAAAAPAAAAKKEEPKKEEKKKDDSEDEGDMGFGLFD